MEKGEALCAVERNAEQRREVCLPLGAVDDAVAARVAWRAERGRWAWGAACAVEVRGRGGLEGAARATLATHRLPTESSSVTTLIFRESALVATPRIMQMLGWCSLVMSATSCAKPSTASRLPSA